MPSSGLQAGYCINKKIDFFKIKQSEKFNKRNILNYISEWEFINFCLYHLRNWMTHKTNKETNNKTNLGKSYTDGKKVHGHSSREN